MEIPFSILQSLIYELNHFIWSEVSPAGKKSHQQEARHLPGRQAGATGAASIPWEDRLPQVPLAPRDHPEPQSTFHSPAMDTFTRYQALKQAEMTLEFKKTWGTECPPCLSRETPSLPQHLIRAHNSLQPSRDKPRAQLPPQHTWEGPQSPALI